jgi:hypothetical protein
MHVKPVLAIVRACWAVPKHQRQTISTHQHAPDTPASPGPAEERQRKPHVQGVLHIYQKLQGTLTASVFEFLAAIPVCPQGTPSIAKAQREQSTASSTTL